MVKKEGRIVATGINAQGVPWKEISFVEEKKEKTKKEIDIVDRKLVK